MLPYLPFLDDPAAIATFDRQRFVVLRAPDSIAAFFEDVRRRLRERLSDAAVSYPARAHVTLAGFAPGTNLEAIQRVVNEWSKAHGPLRLDVECLSSFPSPFQIAIIQFRKDPELFNAFADLRERAQRALLPVGAFIPVDQWTFHASVAYCAGLSASAWSETNQFLQSLHVPSVSVTASSAEIVAFDDHREYLGGMTDFTGG